MDSPFLALIFWGDPYTTIPVLICKVQSCGHLPDPDFRCALRCALQKDKKRRAGVTAQRPGTSHLVVWNQEYHLRSFQWHVCLEEGI